MLGNYLLVALRNIARHKLYSFINICGLAVGLACVILIALFIRDETSFDKWVPDSANLYRVDESFYLPGRPPIRTGLADFPLAALLKDNLPEVTSMTRFWARPRTVKIGDRTFPQDVVEVDPDFFRVVRFPLVQGDPGTVLTKPDAIVLSQAAARKFFGDANPLGKTLAVNKQDCPTAWTVSCANQAVILRVTGIMADLPHNTHVRADALISHTSTASVLTNEGKKSYFNMNGFGYVRLAPGSDPAAVVAKIPKLLDQHVNVMEDLGMQLQASKTIQVRLVPFSTVHLDDASQLGEMVPPGSRVTLYGLGMIGFLILLVACFNFTNLATARAMVRAREIALRKCVGAHRGQLLTQFLGESVLMASIALVLALSVVEVLLPAYGRFLGRPMTLSYIADWQLMTFIVIVAVAAGLLSGIYPALILSRFRPALALRAEAGGRAGGSLRSILVVFQFTVAIGLAIVASAVFSQIDFARNQSLGFRRDNILVIETYRLMTADARNSFVEELRRHPGILDVAVSGDIPFSGSEEVAQMLLPGHPEYLTMHRQLITPEFFGLYGMWLVAGRALSDARGEDRIKNPIPPGNDGRNIVINQAAAARFGFAPAQAVGKIVLFGPSHVRIVGVFADAQIDGAREPARPAIYLNDRNDSNFVSVRIAPGQIPDAMAFVDRSWRRFAPNVAIDRHFLNESFDKLYLADQRQGAMFGVFVAVAIFIACLGLFGLAAFTASRRTREIGIRKVFGARTRDLIFLLLWQFSIPVLIANAIAWPVAWLYLRDWLQSFAYHIALNPLYFVAAGFAALVIAWATILAHAVRVARANPIHALRYE